MRPHPATADTIRALIDAILDDPIAGTTRPSRHYETSLFCLPTDDYANGAGQVSAAWPPSARPRPPDGAAFLVITCAADKGARHRRHVRHARPANDLVVSTGRVASSGSNSSLARAPRGVSTTTCSRLLAGGPASRMPELDRTEAQQPRKRQNNRPRRRTRTATRDYPARRARSTREQSGGSGVYPRRSCRDPKVGESQICLHSADRSSSLACSAGSSSRFHWRALPEAFQQRWIFGGDRSWACAARSQSAAFSRIE
jgi:hypothetical protein